MHLKTLIVAALVGTALQAAAAETLTLATDLDKESYALGAELARNLMLQGGDISTPFLLRGMREGLAGEKLLLSKEEIAQAVNLYQVDLKKKRVEAGRRRARDFKKDGEVFQAQHKKEPGVVTLPSGLQYKVIKEGDGKVPRAGDTVECHYRGTHIDGREFDSSYAKGTPATLAVNGVIPGWQEALKLMRVGSKWQLVVPPQLAYAGRGSEKGIGPFETLVFEVELLALK